MLTVITLFVVLAVLWTYDMVQTVELSNRFGPKIEENPVSRFFLKHSKRDFIIFKIFDLIVLGIIIKLIFSESIMLASSLLFLFVLIYMITVLHNYLVIKKYD